MSAFTSSAPIITTEDEIVEREALSDDERQMIRDEAYGTEFIMPETETMLTEGTALMAQALQAMPDTGVKLAYLEALKRAPELVERESDPAAFLRCEQYDYWAAADRLVKYWDIRKMIFGPDRAFLPMTQAGAMLEDMEYLQKGLYLILPDDKFGRSVMYWNRIRSTSNVIPRDSLSRCNFYLLQAACERKSTQRKGLIMIINFRGFDLYKHFDRILAKKLLSIMNAVPTRVRASHHFWGLGKGVMNLVLPVAKHMVGKQIRLRIHLHTDSEMESLAQFKAFGLGEEHAHGIFGRSLRNQDIFSAWMDKRRRLEQAREEYRDPTNEVAESLAIVDDEDHNSSM